MPCQVGMTTNPQRRREEWERDRRIQSIANWRIVDRAATKTEAQRKEREWAAHLGCKYGEGGAGPEFAHWYIYVFEYTRRIIR